MRKEIKKASEILKKGGVILFLTDTIWGIGCDATNSQAVKRIFDIKKRLPSKSLIVLVHDIVQLEEYVDNVPVVAKDIIKNIDEPLTIIYEKGKNLAKEVTANDESIAVRIPKSQLCLDLLKEFGKPITSTSANISGTSIPIAFSKISDQIRNAVDYTIIGDKDIMGRPKSSTIIKIKDNEEMEIIRN